MEKKTKLPWGSYLYMAGVYLLLTPLIFAYFALDYNYLKSGVITAVIYFGCLTLSIIMFNYLEGIKPFKSNEPKWYAYRTDL